MQGHKKGEGGDPVNDEGHIFPPVVDCVSTTRIAERLMKVEEIAGRLRNIAKALSIESISYKASKD